MGFHAFITDECVKVILVRKTRRLWRLLRVRTRIFGGFGVIVGILPIRVPDLSFLVPLPWQSNYALGMPPVLATSTVLHAPETQTLIHGSFLLVRIVDL